MVQRKPLDLGQLFRTALWRVYTDDDRHEEVALVVVPTVVLRFAVKSGHSGRLVGALDP